MSRSDSKYNYKPVSAEAILNLFFELDEKKKGIITVQTVLIAAKNGKLGPLHHKDADVQYILDCDKNKDGYLSIQEFVEFIRAREAQLVVALDHLELHEKGDSHDLEKHSTTFFGRTIELSKAKQYLAHLHNFHVKNPNFAIKKKYSYTPLSMDEIVAMFIELDANSDGVITLDELLQDAKLGKLGILHNRDACVKYFDEADVNHDGRITIAEFVSFIRKREIVLADLFWHMDKHHTGRVDALRLQKFASKVAGQDLSLENAKAFVDELDSHHNGSFEIDDLIHGALFTTGDMKHIFKTWGNARSYLFDDGQTDTSSLTNFLAGLVAGISENASQKMHD